MRIDIHLGQQSYESSVKIDGENVPEVTSVVAGQEVHGKPMVVLTLQPDQVNVTAEVE